MKLPKPEQDNGTYKLPDGSRIYQSAVRPKSWFLFIFSHNTKDRKGKPKSKGEILLSRQGIWYFDTPQQALTALQEINGTNAKRH